MGSGIYLNNSIKKYGIDSFQKEILFLVDTREEAFLKEKYLIESLNPEYNLTKGGEGFEKNHKTWNKGIRLSEEHIQNLRDSHKGNKLSEETKKKISILLKGENHPLFGKNHSDESKQKMSETHKGKTISEETKKKISEALKGEKNPFFGRKHSEETKKRISESKKKLKCSV